MPIVYFDFETFGVVDLKKRSGYAYAADPMTAVTCAYAEIGAEKVYWTPVCIEGFVAPPGVAYAYGIEWLRELFSNPNNVFIGHNTEFDAAIAEITLGLPVREWFDTMAISDFMGFPGSLDGVGQHLFGQGKDKAGYRLMMALCKPGRNGKQPVPTLLEQAKLCIYNMRDVEITRKYYEGYFGWLPDFEEPVYRAHRAINRRGVNLDVPFIRGLWKMNHEIAYRAGAAATNATLTTVDSKGQPAPVVGDDLTRVEFLQDWINDQLRMTDGGSIDTCDEDTLVSLRNSDDPRVPQVVKAVAEARMAVASAAVHKLGALMRRMSPDGRLRGEYRYCIGEGTRVPTDRGPVEIQHLKPGFHRVWDGVDYVDFDGLIDNGVRPCICIDQTWLTSDHEVLDQVMGWVPAGDLAQSHYRTPGMFLADGRLSVSHSSFGSSTRDTSMGHLYGWSPADASAEGSTTSRRGTSETSGPHNASAAQQMSVSRATESTRMSSPMTVSVEAGETGGTGSTAAAMTRPTKSIAGMVGLASRSAMSGAPVAERSSSSPSLSPDGIKSFRDDSTSIGSTHSVGMSRATSESSPTESTMETGGIACSSTSRVSDSAPRRRTDAPNQQDATTRSSGQLKQPQKLLRVYDIKNAGPRHRFQAGRLIAHNCGAVTGRWKSLGVQIHNLPRPHPMFMSDANPPTFKGGEVNPWCAENIIEAIHQAAIAREGEGDLERMFEIARVVDAWRASHVAQLGINEPVTLTDCFRSVVRSVFIPTPGKVLVGADFAQIEARGAAWLAEDLPALDAFYASDAGTGPDIYCLMAGEIFKRTVTKKDKPERHLGKQSELGAIYGMSGHRFGENNAAALERAGVSGQVVIDAWRHKHRATVRYWKLIDWAMKNAIITGKPCKALRIVFTCENRLMRVLLPSGRTLQYHNPQVVPSRKFEGATEVQYDNYRKGEGEYAVMHLHGAKMFENIVQAICRDLLAEKLVECENVGLPVVMHTHDEVNTECDEPDAEDVARWLEERMATPPAWAKGFPMKGEPSIMHRYGK
jgi:hypothetical protein